LFFKDAAALRAVAAGMLTRNNGWPSGEAAEQFARRRIIP
jgi:hypothetical protein